ncbi:hypothetical protein GCM10009555_107420 [Acrocarpospora macrocephala]|uniref:Uncharacterized protein n=1 Tax=Acrocarpospora macrocephala TaxID=150177 RepID=A0A5M3XDK1_9ACTN|nr:hypothetical protein [Acrocarpospora macrocephala]GES16963.1 hypothetical protein Amac_105610 [Acrocarpospora macrocephala]
MELTVTVEVGDRNELRDLYGRIKADRGLRSTARLVEGEPAPEELSTVTQALQIILGAGATVTGITGVVIAWLRHRSSEFTIRLHRGGTELELTAKGLSTMDSAQIAQLTEKVAAALADQPANEE